MNEQFEAKLIAWVESLENAAISGADFAAEQVPLVLQEYLNWMTVAYSMNLAFSLTLLILSGICFYISRASYLKHNKVYDGFSGTYAQEVMMREKCNKLTAFTIFGLIGGSLLFLGGIMSTCDNAHGLVKVCVAPRVVLIEKASDLVGK